MILLWEESRVMRNDLIHISYEITFATPFHCGTGLRVGLIDRTIVRDQNGYLYVPGSTIKGVVREHCELLARLYEDNLDEARDLIASPHDEKVALWAITHPPTMITRIFGAQHSPGLLFFDDAHQREEDKEQYDSREEDGKGKYKSLQTDLYTQVRLDRITRTATQGALYTSEFGVKDIAFKGSISGWLNCLEIEDLPNDGPTYSLLLLIAGLRMVERLGGNKSTGKGKCSCEVREVKINGSDQNWPDWLKHLEHLSLYSLVNELNWEENA
jgi:CRISPR/Cas system CMR subunit Cmr4 (Cas7 group RAMP superfamily)